MLVGCFQGSVDEKSRVVFPSGLHRGVGPEAEAIELLLLPGSRHEYLVLLSREAWERWIPEQAGRLDEGDEESRRLLRELLASTHSVTLDKRRRLLLPEVLRCAAGIQRDVVFLGMVDRVELWPLERWSQRLEERRGQSEPPPSIF